MPYPPWILRGTTSMFCAFVSDFIVSEYLSDTNDGMSNLSTFYQQQHDIRSAFETYNGLAASGADAFALTAAEHQIYLISRALTTQLTPPGVFALDNVFQVGTHLFN